MAWLQVGMAGRHSSQSRKLRIHILNHKQRRESKLEVRNQALNSQILSLVTHFLNKAISKPLNKLSLTGDQAHISEAHISKVMGDVVHSQSTNGITERLPAFHIWQYSKKLVHLYLEDTLPRSPSPLRLLLPDFLVPSQCYFVMEASADQTLSSIILHMDMNTLSQKLRPSNGLKSPYRWLCCD